MSSRAASYRCMYCSKHIQPDEPWAPSQKIAGQRLHEECYELIYGDSGRCDVSD